MIESIASFCHLAQQIIRLEAVALFLRQPAAEFDKGFGPHTVDL